MQFNKPIGVRETHFSPEAKLVLSLGHKFALIGNLHSTLMSMLESTRTHYSSLFNALHRDEERQGLLRWTTRMKSSIMQCRKPSPHRIDVTVARGIQHLKQMGVVLKQADKNLGLVAMHPHVYHMMVMSHLRNSQTYRRVGVFPYDAILSRVLNIMNLCRLQRHKKEHLLELTTSSSKDPAPFYAMPKIHKKKLHASRPIAAQHSYVLSPLSRALAKVLAEEVKKLPSIPCNSKEVAQTLEEFIFKDDAVFLTFDVEACYPNINQSDSLRILRENVPILNEDGGFWYKVLQLILFNNYVEYDGQVYRQMEGTAMGTSVAPPYANLYLHYKFQPVLSRYGTSLQLYRRFIDDGFAIINSMDSGVELMREMNNCSNMKLTHELSPTHAIFLDFEVYKGERFNKEKMLDFRPYFKPTNRFLYLPAVSNHPKHMQLSIVRGEAIRCLRNSSSKISWLEAMHKIFKGLIARGYQGVDIQRRWKTVRWEDRHRWLYSSAGEAEKPDGILITTKYHPLTNIVWRRLTRLHSPIRQLRPIGMSYNARQKAVIEAWPPTIVFKEFRKIGNVVVKATDTGKNSEGVRNIQLNF